MVRRQDRLEISDWRREEVEIAVDKPEDEEDAINSDGIRET